MKAEICGLICVVLLFAWSGFGHAQQNCEWRPEGPLGPAWYQPGSGSACNNNAQRSAAPPARWASQWGAIASSSNTGHVGTSANKNSKQEAERIAMQQCGADDDISDCTIRISYENGCAAYAWGDGKEVTSNAASVEKATQLALSKCNKEGRNCKIYYSECSLPERIQ